MTGKRIKQINNLVITRDEVAIIDYFGKAVINPNYGKYSVWTPDGRCWEDGLSLEQAEDFCKNTKDFLTRKPKLDDVVSSCEQVNKDTSCNSRGDRVVEERDI